MKRLFLILFLVAPLSGHYRVAVPGYQFRFPRDYFNHPQFQTEWWYYTGNLRTPAGRPFGIELTFFRLGISPHHHPDSLWNVANVYMAHLALSDIDGHRFLYHERLNRAGPGIAGVDFGCVWNGNWETIWKGNDQQLRAIADDFDLHLRLRALKPPVINGKDGLSQKAPGRGNASYYFSLPLLATAGSVTIQGETFPVSGTTWMDHEFFTEPSAGSIAGWDWFCLQLDNRTELMFYRLRLKKGGISPYSSGTFVAADGHSRFLGVHDFSLTPSATWTSPHTHARYPVVWKIEVPSLRLQLEATTPLDDQELVSKNSFSPTYWEGAIRVKGEESGKTAKGVGYLEMTGYAQALKMNY
ncbi:MAG: lipocalin-like domain-containing protein [Terriglobia bacterium]